MPALPLILLILTASAQEAAPPWQEFSLTPSNTRPSVSSKNRVQTASIHAESITLSRLLGIAINAPSLRIVGPDWVDSEHWAVVAVPAMQLQTRGRDEAGEFHALLLQELIGRFALAFHREKREREEVLVLRIAQGSKWGPRPAPGSEQGHIQRSGTPLTNINSTIEGRGVTFDTVAKWLERVFGKPVVLDPGLPPGGWTFQLKWRTGDEGSLKQALAGQLGLELIASQQTLEYLIIDRVQRPSAQGTKAQ